MLKKRENIGRVKNQGGHAHGHGPGPGHVVVKGQGHLDTSGQGQKNVTRANSGTTRHVPITVTGQGPVLAPIPALGLLLVLVHALVLVLARGEGADQVLMTEVDLDRVREKDIPGTIKIQISEERTLGMKKETKEKGP